MEKLEIKLLEYRKKVPFTRTNIQEKKKGHKVKLNLSVKPELLVSQISVPRLLAESVSSGCSRLMLPCFLAKRGGILDAMFLFFTCT